jgi:glycosyltransferase involved in cell wall biosynthesis
LEFDDREKAKAQFAEGKEYFFTDITGVKEDELVELLKAFSRFKKRLHSNLKMVLAGYPAAAVKVIDEKLDSYKYRQDVIWYREYTGLLAAGAYAIIRPFPRVDLGLAVMEAWKSGVPVVTVSGSATGDIAGVAGDAVLYARPGDAGSLAENLMLIYKDERLRASLIEKGSSRLKDFSPEAAADAIWNALQI